MTIDIKRFTAGIHDYLGKAFAPVNARINALEARINLMEAQTKDFAYVGVWESGRTYKRHNSVTQNGGLWICRTESTRQKPGDGPDWQLAVRRGKDGRDAAA